MECQSRLHEDVMVLTPPERQDFLQSELVVALERALGAGIRRFVLDFSRVNLIASPTLTTLYRLERTLRSRGGQAVIAGLNPLPTRILALTGFNHLFDSYQDLEHAFRALGIAEPARLSIPAAA